MSTKDQGENGYGLDAQRDALESYCEENDFELLTVIPDVMSGRKTDKLYGRAAAVAAIKAGLADVLVLKDFDRVTRNAEDGLGLMREAKEEGWRIVTTKGEDTDDISNLELTIKLAFAQEEREKISARTKAGLARARRQGTRSGRPIGNPSKMPRALVDSIVDLRMRKQLGARAIASHLTREGVPTPTGGEVWSPSTVRGVFAREGIA